MYKVAVFSDIHGNKEALEAIFKDIRKDIFDEVICLGDVIGLGPNSKECLNMIADSDIKWLLGNHDLYFINGMDKFNIEPEKQEHYKWVYKDLTENERKKIKNKKIEYILNIENHSFKFCHYFIKDNQELYPFFGIGKIKRTDPNHLIDFFDTEYIIYGHDHTANELNIKDKYLIDVGSSGCVKDDKTFYTIIEIGKDVKIYKKYISFNRSLLEEKIKKCDSPYIEHIAKGFFGIEDLQK